MMSRGFEKPYRLEFFQSSVGQIIHFLPVVADGAAHPSAKDLWKGQTTVQFPGVPPAQLQFDLPGPGLFECIAAWDTALQECVEQMRSEMLKRAIANGAQQSIGKQIALS